jgi:4-carboxymuconolactone decarboxylase
MAENLTKYFPDPDAAELRESIQNIFDYESLSLRYRLLTAIASCQAIADTALLKGFIDWGFDSEISYREIYELLLQGHLFCGYPRAIESFFTLAEVAKKRNLDDFAEAGGEPWDAGLFASRGRQTAELIYGKNLDLVLSNIRGRTPELAAGMINEGYGRIISRDGLDLIARELAIVAILTVSGMPRQLYSHIRGAANVGASVKQVKAVIDQCRLFVDKEIIAGCLSILEKSLGK